jgi:integrase
MSFEQRMRAELLSGTFGREVKRSRTLGDFAADFLKVYVDSTNKASEQAAKRGHLNNHLLPFMGAKRLDAITAKVIDAYKAEKLKERLNRKSINNQLSTLRRLLRKAVDWQELDSAPKVEPFRLPDSEFGFLSFSEAERLIAAAEEGLWRTMVITALNTGLRLGELMGLRWQDVDLVSQRLVVRKSLWKDQMGAPKNGLFREIALNSELVAALKAHRHLRGEQVFCQENGNPLTQQICRRALMRACKIAGLRHVQWHCMRHSFASHLW